MAVRPIILYEDSLPQEARNYGPHELVLACVVDELGARALVHEQLRDARPQNGVSKKVVAKIRKQTKLDATS